MATSFEELLKSKLAERGLPEDLGIPSKSAAPVTGDAKGSSTISQGASAQGGIELAPALVPTETTVQPEPDTTTPDSPIPGFKVIDAPVSTGIPGFEIINQAPTFDNTTVITPEMLQGLDYQTIYDLAGVDSPLSPDQRDVVANALRGSSDLANVVSGYDPTLGNEADVFDPFADVSLEEAKKSADAYLTGRSQATAGNTAVVEAVKNARKRYLEENPTTPQGMLDQVNQGLITGAAAPIPEGATGGIAPSTRRAVLSTAIDSGLFGFADELAGSSNPAALSAKTTKDVLREREPTAALLSEIGGAVLSPSVGLKALGALGKGLSGSDKWYQTIAKVAAASGADAALTAVGNDGQIANEAITGSLIGTGAGTTGAVLKLGGVVSKSLYKLLGGEKTDVDVAEKVVTELSKLTNIDKARLVESIKGNKNIVDVLTENGLSVEDAGKAVSALATKAPSNTLSTELAANASSKVSDITNKSTDDVIKYLKSIDPTDIGDEIGMLYKVPSGSDIANITKRLMQTDGKSMYSDAIRTAIAQRAAADANILAGSGRSKVKAGEILIDPETGGIYVPNEGAIKLTGDKLKEVPNKFGYAKDDLFEITDGDNLRGDVFQSADSKLAEKITFKEGAAPDQAFSKIVNRLRDESKQIMESSIEGLGAANNAYSKKKAAKTVFDLTDSFTKKKTISPDDIDAYITSMDSLSKITDADHKEAVVNGIKNFFGSNAKTADLLDSTGALNPQLRSTFEQAGISKADLDSFEKMARDKTFFSEFLKSTGVKTNTEDNLVDAARIFAARLFFNTPVAALRNTALSMVGKQASKSIDNTSASKIYRDIVTNIAKLDEKDFTKIQAIVDKNGEPYMKALMNYLSAKVGIGGAKYSATE